MVDCCDADDANVDSVASGCCCIGGTVNPEIYTNERKNDAFERMNETIGK